MSRCYPYPPPGYVRNGIRDEALIESIKIQREEEKAKKDRKKEKREKKDKKREKKERSKGRDVGEIESKKHGHKKRHKDERSQADKKEGDHFKRRENEVESFEKSTLTEEHGHAVGSQNSSDSTLNSNKRQKLSSPADSGHNSGSIIRIRLPSQRHKDPEVLPSKEQPCSTSGRIDGPSVQGMHEQPAPRPGKETEEQPFSTSRIRRPELTFKLSKEKACSSSGALESHAHHAESFSLSNLPVKLSKEKPCSSSGASESHAHRAESLPSNLPVKLSKEKPGSSSCASESHAHRAESSLLSNLCCSCSPTLALQFKNLVEDWVVPTRQSEWTDSDGDDWVLQRKRKLDGGVKSGKDGNTVSSQKNSTTWPQACYLPEADIYALPFTIPF